MSAVALRFPLFETNFEKQPGTNRRQTYICMHVRLFLAILCMSLRIAHFVWQASPSLYLCKMIILSWLMKCDAQVDVNTTPAYFSRSNLVRSHHRKGADSQIRFELRGNWFITEVPVWTLKQSVSTKKPLCSASDSLYHISHNKVTAFQRRHWSFCWNNYATRLYSFKTVRLLWVKAKVKEEKKKHLYLTQTGSRNILSKWMTVMTKEAAAAVWHVSLWMW